MKQHYWLISGTIGCIIFSAVGFFWATELIDSVFNYRSPLQFTAPAPGEPLSTQLSHRVVIFLIDSLRYDTSLNTSVMPYLNNLRAIGASAQMHSQPPSYSEPGYATLLTGAWPDLNDGPVVNLEYPKIPTFTQDDIFSAAHRMGIKTAITGYYWFEKLVPQTSVDASFYTPEEDSNADREVMNAAMKMLSGDFQLILIHIDQVDYAGHYLGGPNQPQWNQAAKQADDYLNQVVSALDFSQDTAIILSDHGQIDRGGHGGPEPITLLEPFVMAGAGVRGGKAYSDITQVDIAPTIAVLLGTNIPASAEGRPLTEMLNLSSKQIVNLRSAEILQKKVLFQAYTRAIGTSPKQQPDPGVPFSYIIGINNARSLRLGRERAWRNLAAISLAVFTFLIILSHTKKRILWIACGVFVYVLIFNFRYAVLEGHTYSLSSIDSQSWLITFSATTSSVALVIGWLITMNRLQAFQMIPRRAAEISLEFIFCVLYLLGLPIMINFAINGSLVTWTLPEFYSSFTALMSLIQWMFVSLCGLFLTGVASLVGHFASRPGLEYSRTRR